MISRRTHVSLETQIPKCKCLFGENKIATENNNIKNLFHKSTCNVATKIKTYIVIIRLLI